MGSSFRFHFKGFCVSRIELPTGLWSGIGVFYGDCGGKLEQFKSGSAKANGLHRAAQGDELQSPVYVLHRIGQEDGSAVKEYIDTYGDWFGDWRKRSLILPKRRKP
jgi:hypothetical protein